MPESSGIRDGQAGQHPGGACLDEPAVAGSALNNRSRPLNARGSTAPRAPRAGHEQRDR
jgi:hypothetical protein